MSMNKTMVTKIRDGKIAIPQKWQKRWGATEVVFLPGQEGAYIKPLLKPSLSTLKSKLKKMGGEITDKELEEAVVWARKQTYENRS